MATDRKRAEEIDDLISKIEPRLQEAFREGLEKIRAEVSLSEIERAIRFGDYAAAAELISGLIVGAAFIEFHRKIQEAVQAGGDIAARWAAEPPNRIVFALNVTESNTARFIRDYQAGLVRETTREIQEVLGRIALDGVNAGENPRVVARRMRDSIGLTSRQEQAVRNYEQLLRDRDKDALRRALRDKRYDRAVLSAAANQKDIEEEKIQRMVDAYRRRSINKRAETIARTEAIRLLSVGQHEFWEQAVSEGLVNRGQLRRKWINTADGRVRESHVEIPFMNKEGVGQDEPFQSPLGPIMFPGDPSAPAENSVNCRCAVFTRVGTG